MAHALLVDDGCDLGSERSAALEHRGVDRAQQRHLLPNPRVVEPPLGRQIHPPRPEAAERRLRGVAPHHLSGLLQVDEAALLDVLGLARIQIRARVVLVQPQDAGARNALGRRHAGSGADPLAVGVRDRRAEDVDVASREQGGERVVAARRRAVRERRELEKVAVEEDDELASGGAAAAGRGEGGDMVGHLLLLEAGEAKQALLPGRVAQEAVRVRAR